MELSDNFDSLMLSLKKFSAVLMAQGMMKGGDARKIVLGNAISVACAVYDVGELGLCEKLLKSLQGVSEDIQKLAEEGHPNLKGLTVKTGKEIFKDDTSAKIFKDLLEEMTGVKIDLNKFKAPSALITDFAAGPYILEIKKKGKVTPLKDILEGGLNIGQM